MNPASISLSLALAYMASCIAADECQPETWGRKRAVAAAGEMVCRYDTTTDADVSYYTCKEICDTYSLPFEVFLALNPGLDKDCANIKPETTYCVDGCTYRLITFATPAPQLC
jgi:hypothetical protein